MTNKTNKYNAAIIIAGVLFIIWGIFGMLDSKNYAYDGYGTDDAWTVNNIEEGSPAEEAGLQIGDVIVSNGGIDVTNTKALSERSRSEIGETRALLVNRNGEETTINITFSELPEKNQTNNTGGFIIGLIFVLLGLYANHKFKTELATAYAVFSICFGFLFLNGPYIENSFLGDLIGLISTIIVLFSFTALAIYMLRYPPVSTFISNKNFKYIYLPMVLITLLIAVLVITKMDSSATQNMVLRLIFAIFIITYFLIALITLIRKYSRTSAEDRKSTGLTSMLIGSVIGLLPIIIYFTIGTISPGTQLPGDDYVFYTFLAIPIFFTLALTQLYKTQSS